MTIMLKIKLTSNFLSLFIDEQDIFTKKKYRERFHFNSEHKKDKRVLQNNSKIVYLIAITIM